MKHKQIEPQIDDFEDLLQAKLVSSNISPNLDSLLWDIVSRKIFSGILLNEIYTGMKQKN